MNATSSVDSEKGEQLCIELAMLCTITSRVSGEAAWICSQRAACISRSATNFLRAACTRSPKSCFEVPLPMAGE